MKRLERIVRHSRSGRVSSRVRTCRMCGYVWESRKDSGMPKSCPKCRSTLWDSRTVGTASCRRCGHAWTTTMGRPPKCPSCGSKRWDADILTVVCCSCGRRWKSALKKDEPVACPECGELPPSGYRVESAEIPDSGEAPLSEAVLEAMWKVEDDLDRAVFLRNIGLTPEHADVIVSFDRGDPVPDIAARMSMPVSEIMEAVLPFMGLCESMGVRSWS